MNAEQTPEGPLESTCIDIGGQKYIRQYFPADAPMVAMIRPHWDEIVETMKIARKELIDIGGEGWIIKQLTDVIGDSE